MRIRNSVLIAWLIVPMAGCATLNDARYEHTQKSRTRSAWRSLSDCAKQHRYPKDYALGWKDGFYDVTTGGKGCPPVVAPERYWKPGQILHDCDNRRHAYYDGFQDGAAHALQFPDTHHLKVWSSCECPLPTCEQCCSSLADCPTGSCGFSVYSEHDLVPVGVPPTAIEINSVIDEAPIGSSVIQEAPLDDSAQLNSDAAEPLANALVDPPTVAPEAIPEAVVEAVPTPAAPRPVAKVIPASAPTPLARIAEPLSDMVWEQMASSFQTLESPREPEAVAAFAEGMIDQSMVVEAEPIRMPEPSNGPVIRLATEIELPVDQ